MRNRLAIGVAVMMVVGCAPPDTAPMTIQRTRATFSATKNVVWPLIIAEIGLNYPVQALEKESGLITTQNVKVDAGYNNMYASRFVVPPRGFLATWGGLRMNMRILAVEVEPGKTQVKINCHYEAFESNVQKAWVIAATNGSVENEILSSIESKLAK